MPQGIIDEVEVKPKTNKHREYRRVCIEGTWYSCWLKSLFPFLNKGDLVDFKVKVSGDFENIIDVKGIRKLQEQPIQPGGTQGDPETFAPSATPKPKVSATITKPTVQPKTALSIVNDLQGLLNLCKIAVKVTYKHELKKNPELDITSTVNTLLIQLFKMTGGKLIEEKKKEDGARQ